MNYAPLTGANFVNSINAGASPCAIICRPYGTCPLQSFTGYKYYLTTNFTNLTNIHLKLCRLGLGKCILSFHPLYCVLLVVCAIRKSNKVKNFYRANLQSRVGGCPLPPFFHAPERWFWRFFEPLCAKKPCLRCEEALFARQNRLCCAANKASFLPVWRGKARKQGVDNLWITG